jgi:hypothetical protein
MHISQVVTPLWPKDDRINSHSFVSRTQSDVALVFPAMNGWAIFNRPLRGLDGRGILDEVLGISGDTFGPDANPFAALPVLFAVPMKRARLS